MTYLMRKKKNGREYLSLCEGKRINGKTVQKHIRYIGVVPTIGNKNTSKRDKKLIRDAQIIDQLAKSKSEEDLAYLYNVTTRTIKNIKKRFEEQGGIGLIHTRESKFETVKVTSPEQAAIVTDIVQHPNKSSKEIKKTTGVNTPIALIEKLISPVLKHLKSKKKVLLEIQLNSKTE